MSEKYLIHGFTYKARNFLAWLWFKPHLHFIKLFVYLQDPKNNSCSS